MGNILVDAVMVDDMDGANDESAAVSFDVLKVVLQKHLVRRFQNANDHV